MGSCVTDEREAHVAVDPRYLEQLRAELDGDCVAVNGFVATFVSMWPNRLQRVTCATNDDNVGALVDSALSIRSSSAMVGAVRLNAVASDLEQLGRAGDLAGVRRLIPHLRTVGDRTIERLSQMLLS
ncbi:Hpt domain-containing protein [Paramicrobacterium fandaimingii]|uniref:Hpt domain-containing protein n=1 Tax=Paramicrobacterium fandaimingii TaxID=2708079 RepID=UPI00141F04E5|nr:Hpt domain-containing protein [Microbacterium fandaimingii]